MCIALVCGNMIGSGVFLLPASLAPYGMLSLVGWGLTSAGAICLALVFAATITGIAAIRSVVRGVEDLTRIQKQALEEGTDVWDSPDAAVNQPAQDVPVATAQPSPAPSAAGSASSSLQQGAGQSGSASGGIGP